MLYWNQITYENIFQLIFLNLLFIGLNYYINSNLRTKSALIIQSAYRKHVSKIVMSREKNRHLKNEKY